MSRRNYSSEGAAAFDELTDSDIAAQAKYQKGIASPDPEQVQQMKQEVESSGEVDRLLKDYDNDHSEQSSGENPFDATATDNSRINDDDDVVTEHSLETLDAMLADLKDTMEESQNHQNPFDTEHVVSVTLTENGAKEIQRDLAEVISASPALECLQSIIDLDERSVPTLIQVISKAIEQNR